MFTLKNASGMEVTLVETGASIQSILVPDRNGVPGDVVLGCEEAGYPAPGALGATVGRFANRIGGAAFPLNGKTVHVTPNEGKNCLHGGVGFHMRRWTLEGVEGGARCRYLSADGEEGFPGNMQVQLDVSLTDSGSLNLDYQAICDADTVVNLTNHSYFNLACGGTVLEQELMLAADHYLEVDMGLIPTGKLIPVEGTDFDFRSRRPIRSGLYDHCFVLQQDAPWQAEAWDPASGRGLRMKTDLPGVQLYCGAGLEGVMGKGGVRYQRFGGFCLETQLYPDSPNRPEFPSAFLRAGECWKSRTEFAFFAE